MTHRVYRLYDVDDRLLYVGVTSATMAERLRAHRRERPWFDQIARVEVDPSVPRAEAFYEEQRQITTLRPLHNHECGVPATIEHPTTRFGAGLRSARVAASMSQAELAELAGVSLQTVRRWETGTTGLSGYHAVWLCRELSVDLISLLAPEPAA